jgi:hypothetical protein
VHKNAQIAGKLAAHLRQNGVDLCSRKNAVKTESAQKIGESIN